MKIYRNDGSWYRDKFPDNDFGWNLNDVLLKTPSRPAQRNETSFYDTIAVQEAESTINFDLMSIEEDVEVDIDDKVPRKSQLISLINPCTIESKVLLSVIQYSMFKEFNAKMIKIDDLQRGVNFKFAEGPENIIFDGILNYYHYKNNDILPFLMELILTDNQCDVHEIASEDKTDSLKTDLNVKKTNMEKESRREFSDGDQHRRYNPLYEKTNNISRESEYIHEKILQIKKSLQQETHRVNDLIKKAQTMEGDFRATKFLDDLIHLLNGTLEKVNLKRSPFRILTKLPEQNANLIV